MKSRCISECLGPGRIECDAYIDAAVSARGRGRWAKEMSAKPFAFLFVIYQPKLAPIEADVQAQQK